MLTKTGRETLFGDLTNNDSSGNLTLGNTLMNEMERSVLAGRPWPFLETTDSDSTTTASTQYYDTPADLGLLRSVYITSGDNRYTPNRSPSAQHWDMINSNSSESDVVEWYTIRDGQIGFWPVPASDSLTITFIYRKKLKDLSSDDYTTGNVSAVTNGAKAVTGDSTVWTAPMAGRYIKIDVSDTDGQSGDNQWYEIASVGGNTSLTLDKNYQGLTISGNTGYTIGEIGLIPEEFQILPVYMAAEVYFTSVMPSAGKADMYKTLSAEKLRGLIDAYSNESSDPTIYHDDTYPLNPNLTVRSIG